MTVRARPAAVVLTIVLIPVVMLVGAYGAGFRLNLTPSYPLGLWRIEPLARPVAVGDRIFICPPQTPAFALGVERGYVRTGTCKGGVSPLIKTVVALSGQRIEIAGNVTIDGRVLPHSEVRAVDAAGRALSPYSGGVVPAGTLFLHSDFAGSYDSRYFGPIPASGLLGLAHPIFTFDR
jgi:conjugative transfer signal peptidase TraF